MINSSSSLTSGMTYYPPPLYTYGASTNTVDITYTTPAPEWAKKPKKSKSLADPMEWLRARVGEIVDYGEL